MELIYIDFHHIILSVDWFFKYWSTDLKISSFFYKYLLGHISFRMHSCNNYIKTNLFRSLFFQLLQENINIWVWLNTDNCLSILEKKYWEKITENQVIKWHCITFKCPRMHTTLKHIEFVHKIIQLWYFTLSLSSNMFMIIVNIIKPRSTNFWC